MALKFECVQESLGELSIIWTPGFHPKTLDSLNGGGLGICIPQSTVLWICRPDSHPLSPALWTAVRSVHLQLPLYYRAERILRSQGRTWRHTTDCLKWARKDEHTFMVRPGLGEALLGRMPPHLGSLKTEDQHMVSRNRGLVWDRACLCVQAAGRSRLGALSRLLRLGKGLHSLRGHAAVGCPGVGQASPGRSCSVRPLPLAQLACPWHSSWLIQGNPRGLTLNSMSPVGSWEIAGNLSPSVFFLM